MKEYLDIADVRIKEKELRIQIEQQRMRYNMCIK